MIYRFLARQLGHPTRLSGKIFAQVWNRRNAVLNDTVFAQLDLQPDDCVLEVGFGGGYLLSRMVSVLPNGFLAGVDISQAMVTAANNRFRPQLTAGQLDLQCAQAETLPYPPDYFTKACSVNSIFYWENAPQALAELYRVLRSHGRIVLCQTSPKSLEKRGFASYIERYEAHDIRQMLESAGFQDIQTTNAADKHREFTLVSGVKSSGA